MSSTLYRLFGADGALLYVGITADPATRLRHHRSRKPWWPDVATVSLEHHPTRGAARLAERAAIMAERPMHNVAHNRSRRPRRVVLHTSTGYCAGSAEVSALLRVSRQRVHQLSCRPGFPAPLARLTIGSVWRTADVVKWAEDHGREIHE